MLLDILRNTHDEVTRDILLLVMIFDNVGSFHDTLSESVYI